MKRLFALLLLPIGVSAGVMPDHEHDNGFVGPSVADVELLNVGETAPYGSTNPLAAKIRNNSASYLDRIAIKCTIVDAAGNRTFRRLIFKSAPLFSIDMALPPITTPEMGIPPGAETEVALYTDDDRWQRGFGDYSYDCEMYGVSGRK